MRHTYVTISRSQLQNNFDAISRTCNQNDKKVAICSVIKADAYGHGMVEVAKTLENKTDYFAVAIIEEGVTLRERGITKPILVFAGVVDDEIDIALQNDLTLTASSLDKLESIRKSGNKYGIVPKVHLKIDTGMGRIGVQYERAHDFIVRAHELHMNNEIHCEGIYSHFSDSMNEEFTRTQAKRFQSVIDFAKSIDFDPPYIHMCSSRSIFLYPEYHFTMVRPGIALYGIEPEPHAPLYKADIQPILEWKTRVVFFKVLEKGQPVGYARSYIVQEEYERIITLPVGYADGFPRRLSNNGYVLVHGKKYPVVGRVCMDQIMVSLGKEGEAYVGDSVTLIGVDGDQKITVEEIATLIDTTPHEITTCISLRVPRVYN